jgi:hypothetical protein
VNSVKLTNAILIMILSLLVILPVALPSDTVSAQTSSYRIDSVDHQVQVTYSGHVVVLDTIHVSGQVTDGFMIGLPYKYSANVLKGFAYDDTQVYQLNLGVQLGTSKEFYGATVDFNGNSPSFFTVAFILSNSLITEEGNGRGSLDFPAYPGLTQEIGTCNVKITFPTAPTTVTVIKDDGVVNDAAYTKANLPAYTYSVGNASFQVPTGTVQLTTVSSLNRQVTIEPTSIVTVSDSYRIISNSITTINSFVLSLPKDASNVVVRDEFGRALSADISNSATANILLANATLITFLASEQSTSLTAQYNLPNAKLEGSNYILSDFKLFPETTYYVNSVANTFTPPEGATIVSPQSSSLDSSSTLTRQTYQDTLTVTKNGLSYLDYVVPQKNTIQFSFDYNPVWISLRPTFWALLLAIVGCVAVVFVRRRKPKEETYAEKTERLSTLEAQTATPQQKPKTAEQKTEQHVTVEVIKEFIDAYEDKKQLTAELKSMDAKAQKGKIPRRQYKVQRRAVEIRLEGIARNIERKKETFRGSTGSNFADLVKQLDLAEADLVEAEENIKKLESRQSRGEISIETYKRSIGDFQKQKDKAESAINGILLRLREKIR